MANRYSNFPNTLDQLRLMPEYQDLSISDKQNIERYNVLVNKSSLTTAETTELNNLITTLQDKMVNTSDFNKLVGAVNNMQEYFVNNVLPDISNLVNAGQMSIQTAKDNALIAIEQKKENIITYMSSTEAGQIRVDVGIKGDLLTSNKTSLVSAVNELFTSASDGKTAVANAVTAKGVSASGTDTFTTLATKIGQIPKGQGTAVETQVLSGATFSNADGVLRTGTMINRGTGGSFGSSSSDAYTNSPITTYASNAWVGAFDFPLTGFYNGSFRLHIANLINSNIKAGVVIGSSAGNVVGTFTSDAWLNPGLGAGAILTGNSAYVNGVKYEGTMPNRTFAGNGNVYVQASSVKGDGGGSICVAPQAGYYDPTLNGSGFGQIIATDFDYVPANIVAGKDIFGVAGTAKVIPKCLANKYIVMPTMPYQAMSPASIAVGDIIYNIGGSPDGGSTFMADNRSYNTLTDTWVTKAVAPTAIQNPFGCAVGTKIYVFGAYIGNSNFCYDTTTNTWTSKTVPPSRVQFSGSASVGTNVYIMGGFYSSSYLNVNYCYDTNTDTWSTKANTLYTSQFHTITAVGTKIYMINGYNNGMLARNYCYDTALNTWTAKTACEAASYQHGASTDGVNTISIFGGLDYYTRAYSYNVTTDTWTRLAELPSNRYAFGCSYVNGAYFLMGGANVSNLHTIYLP